MSFSLLTYACFFETNFPNIPFLKPIFGSFFDLLLFLFLCFMFLPFCFYVGFVFGMFLVCFCCVFVVFLVVLSFQTMKNSVLPPTLVF